MEGKETKSKSEPGICPDEYANKKFDDRYFLWIFWQIIFGLQKAYLTATLGRAAGELGDQSRETLHLNPGMMINRYTEVFRANDRKATEQHRHCRPWGMMNSFISHLFSASTLIAPCLEFNSSNSSLSISSKVQQF